MYNYIKQGRSGMLILCLMIIGGVFASCDEAIVIDNVDDSKYQAINESYGYLKNVNSASNMLRLDLRKDTYVSDIYFSLSKVEDKDVTISVEVDADEVLAYNKANFTSFKMFPADAVSLGSNGNISVPKGEKDSAPLSFTLTKNEDIEEGVYLLPISVKDNSSNEVKLSADAKVLYYMITVGSVSATAKPGGIVTLCYVEVNDGNILNVGSYTLKDSGIQFFDIAILFAANVNYNAETKRVHLYFNENVQHVLSNRDKYIKPLQDKGIKVILGLLGNHDVTGVASLSGQSMKDFAAECKAAVDAYGLDGVDFDDEWSSYSTVGPYIPSAENMGRLIIETRRLMPDKIITVFEYGYARRTLGTYDGIAVSDVIDYGLYASYGGYRATSYIPGLDKKKYAPTATWLSSGNRTPTASRLRTYTQTHVVNNGCGACFFYDLRAEDTSAYLSNASQPMFGEDVVMSGDIYQKDY